jgi:hypothetical protein
MTTGTLSLVFLLAFGASSASATDKAAKDVKVDSVVRYDTATVVDFKATVTGIREVPKTDPLDGLYLTVKTDTLKSETFDVYVGPTDFVKAFEITFAKGDKIQVIGSKVKIDGVDILLAREVSRQQTTVILRGKNGDPFWKTRAKPQQ